MMTYSFGSFTFSRERGLLRDGKTVALEPQVFELLAYLIENRGRVVLREELNEHIWNGRIVSEAALSTRIRAVRRALGDDRSQQSFVRTHPKRGFEFVATVEELDEAEAEPTVRLRAELRRGRLLVASLAALVVLAVVAVGLWSAFGPGETESTAAPKLSIAVLPFGNLSGAAAEDYLADAFTEDLITDLSRIRDAFVISRSTTFTYRGKDLDVPSVATELGVRYVLEGSLRVEGEEVRINAQLIDGASDRHLWSERYEVALADLFDVKENVTGRIASALRAELRIAEDERQTPEATDDAWDLALRGNVLLFNRQGLRDFQEAHALLTRAVELDPSIASAWGGLSFIHFAASLGNMPGVTRPDSAALSLEAALKAVEADPKNAEPYWLVGAGYARAGQPERGMAACETALDLNPNMDCGHVCAGLVHLAKGEPEEAVPFFQHALKLNPRFRPFTKEKYLGLAYIQSGRDRMAVEALNRALSKAPDDMFANLALSSALALQGQVLEARAVLTRYEEATGRQPPSLVALRASLSWMGPEVERMLAGLSEAGLPES